MKKMLIAGLLISLSQLMAGPGVAATSEEVFCESNTDGTWKDLGGDPTPGSGAPEVPLLESRKSNIIPGDSPAPLNQSPTTVPVPHKD